MELWIRSQSKLGLYKIDEIYVDERDFGNEDIQYYIMFGQVLLGKYKTKSRAFEVLDEIQKSLSSDFNFNGDYEHLDILIKTKMINGLYGVIYEMPKD